MCVLHISRVLYCRYRRERTLGSIGETPKKVTSTQGVADFSLLSGVEHVGRMYVYVCMQRVE